MMWLTNKIAAGRRFFNKRNRDLERLARQPRYTEGSFNWSNSVLHFPDASSFVFMYNEIFGSNIYKFNSNKTSPFIIDCGANIGMSVIYFKELFPAAQIVAFEPERKIFGFLKQNIASLGLANVDLINKAVWKEEGYLTFLDEGADASRLSLLGDMTERKSSYQVEAMQLSKFINQEVDLLKLDIEGAEVEVLNEVEGKLHFVKRLFVEFHSPVNAPQKLDVILNILVKNGFRYYIDSAFRMRKHPFIDRNAFVAFDFFLNIFAEKSD